MTPARASSSGSAGSCQSRRVHAARDVAHHPLEQHLIAGRVDPVPVRVVRITMEAGGANDVDARRVPQPFAAAPGLRPSPIGVTSTIA